MQKDTVVQTISSVTLDQTNSNTPVVIRNIHSVSVNGQDLGLDGYLDIGLYDTMEDLFVNFVGAVVFSIIGFFYIKRRGEGSFARQFIPTIQEDADEAKFLAFFASYRARMRSVTAASVSPDSEVIA